MRHAIITAGTKGLGRKVTEQLLNLNHSVTVTYRNDKEKAFALLEEFPNDHERIQLIQADVTVLEDLDRLVEETVERFGRVDYLINNAGPYIFKRKKLMDYTEDEWDTMIRGNLDAVFYLLKRTVPLMRKQNFGRIINYGFQGAQSASGWIYRSAFAAAKVGLVSLTKTVAYEEAEYGITSNMICPGNIVGDWKEASIKDSRGMEDKETPIGRPGTGEDISRMIAFLCEEDSDMITGTIYEVTGGLDVIHRHR
ncbi:SDR family oxidoreductase [Halobacillus karajensis]|uniref:3-oxoacyl-[acyl-carrier-protein] reductase FabG n=1 Tax=Halobacillus karajensis TaxID=195088 RepID=A0A024P7P8_9BACI|nr:SDR family oxidoreductase [Halobacillus karajensis]CDQ18302.1 3-oxoacyl-[acyl-carrier-protein] reductase FabG [Halobacillus karajensis]CDQ24656.1 3-oxoacyl-[acyl-carrier-protein] reductase FabG [Halobacillus karajensis]CDQ29098.1 3-oxoacyl-[acyl-carrier-protein] reductase FabG [Halobacillus karajensis]